MAGGMGNTWNNALLNALLGGAAFPAVPTDTYIALFTAAPTDAGGGTEVSGGSYARVHAVNNTGNWGANTSTESKSNAAQLTFPRATADWGTVVGYGIFDAASGGTLLFWAPITAQVINSGVQAFFDIGQLTVSAA